MRTISACTGEREVMKVRDYGESNGEKLQGIAEKGKGGMQQLGGYGDDK